MQVKETQLQGCYIIQPTVFEDSRGYFYESFNENTFAKLTGQTVHFVQDNCSSSTYGVLRGLHFQKGEYAQAKLVSVVKGSVLDVAVDLRTGSTSYGQYVAVELTENNHTQLFIPRGFAHGFVVTSLSAVFTYKCDNFYNKAAEGGVRYDDPSLQINWGINADKLIVSEKDMELPFYTDIARFA